jgi:hypothetical protein
MQEQASRAEAERLVELPEAIRAGILAMICAARNGGYTFGACPCALAEGLPLAWSGCPGRVVPSRQRAAP